MISKELWGKIIKDYLESYIEVIEREKKYEIPKVQRALVITGPRRAGKTFFMFQMIDNLLKNLEKERTIYVNFEDFRLTNVKLNDLENFLDTFYSIVPENVQRTCYFFFDEIQNLEGWEKFVRFLLDKNQKVIISGSSSKLLSREIATELRGRSIQLKVYPFSFKEILKARGISLKEFYSTSEEAKIKKLVGEYLIWGGYPETVINPSLRKNLLKEILELTVFKDIVERWRVTNIKVLKLLLLMLAKSTHLTISKAYKNLKGLGIEVGKTTVANYLEYLEDSLVFYSLKPLVKSYKKQELLGFKPYLVDNGLLTILGIEDRSRLLENLVFVELLKKDSDLFYYTTGKKEVDFVVKKEDQIERLIQVTYELDEENYDREIRNLVEVSRDLDSNNLLVVTWDQEDLVEIDNRKIKIIPLWKWLLQSC